MHLHGLSNSLIFIQVDLYVREQIVVNIDRLNYARCVFTGALIGRTEVQYYFPVREPILQEKTLQNAHR